MKISIFIPVYNEADSLRGCLDAIALQDDMPDEVIVVDNNSSDNSVEIALKYDFVQLLQEPKQGVMHARKLGYDNAAGDIIARIDADTILPPDWLRNIKSVFMDPGIDAVSGIALYYNVS